MRRFAWFVACVFACCLAADTAVASVAPPRIATASLLADGPAAAREGALDAYGASLRDALERELKGKAPKVIAKFAATDAGALAVMHSMLLERVGAEVRADAACRDALAWMLGNPAALSMFLGSGDPAAGKWPEAMRVFAKVANSNERRDGLPLRLSVATALVFAEPVRSMADDSVIDPAARVASYLAWDAEGLLFPTFRELSAWELRYVVGSWSTDEDLVWARANIKADLKRREKVGDAAHMLAYNLTNKNGVSVQEGRRFYDNKPMTMAIMLEYGGVCGAISRFGSSMSQAHGVPAMPVGQPGHCAFIWQQTPHRWSINNDISGWAESGCHGGIYIQWGHPAWLMPVMQDAQRDGEAFAQAEVLLAAAAFADDDDRGALFAEACKACPQHYGAWTRRVAQVKKAQDAKRMPAELAEAFAAHPMAFGALFTALLDAAPVAKPERVAAAQLAAMAKGGADAGLASYALMTVLERQSKGAAGKGAERAAAALVRGDAAGDATIDAEKGMAIVDMALEATDALDVAPNGPAHDAWLQAMKRISRGVMLQPAVRERGMKQIERGLAVLVKNNRAGDARWIADRIVEAAKETKDAGLEQRAAALRSSLG
ncbi:MAG: hypothetical protein LW636_06200 [Planctomycetaceae bacterium]|nr:hypothetical protein [Planctomycetaceae bacterium]